MACLGQAGTEARAIARRWIPDGATRGRVRAAIALNVASLLLAIVLYATVQPPANWDHAWLLLALAAVAVVAYLAEANLKLPPIGFFDASIVLAMLALGLAGPGPALLIWLVPEVMARIITRRVPLITPGFIATVSSFALATLAGAGVLALASPHSASAEAPALYTAGLMMGVVNFSVARLLFAPLYYGFRVRQLVRSEFFDLAPAFLSMLALGVVVWLLIEPLGVFPLALLAVVVIVPQVAVARLSRPRLVSALSVADATALYAAATADVLGVRRHDRRVLETAARLVVGPELTTNELLSRSLPEIREAGFISMHVGERWDGSGWPGAFEGEEIPRLSRVLRVAVAWSELTAAGTVQLSHAEALLDLASRSGDELDPSVVAAAAQVVRDEEVYVGAAAFVPRLHRVALPRAVRRGALPAALARIGAEPS